MLIQKNFSKTANVKAVITPYHSSSSVFTTNNTPSGAKKHHESTEPESRQTVKMFSSSLYSFQCSSSDGLVQVKTAAFSSEQCTSPSLFPGLKCDKAVQTAH